MGNTPSTPPTPEEQRKRDLEERGVLIPPLFAAGYGFEPTETSPSLLTRLQQESLSHSILSRYLTPGVWITSQTNGNGSVLASLVPSSLPHDCESSSNRLSYTDSLSNQQGLLRISQQLNDNFKFDLSYHSHTQPTIAAALHLTPNLKLSSKIDTQGTGWFSCQYRTSVGNFFQSPMNKEYYRNNSFQEEQNNSKLHLHFGSWLDIEAQKDWSKSTDNLLSSIPAAHAYASLQVPGCLMAVHGKLPSTYAKLPEVSYHASVDLASEGPPLTATLFKTPTSSSMGLSQTLQWDRWILNPVEVKCPKIRNTLAWTVQLEKLGDREATPKAGVEWQLNRAVAIKVVAQPHLTGAIIFKRWQQPRIVCSVLVGRGKYGQVGFQGLGVQLEIGSSDGDSDLYQQGSKPTIVSTQVPPTKATLPDEERLY
jgi:hypothetical protein